MADGPYFILLLLGSIFCQAFFTMSEMAFVSFNRVRLAYYVEKGQRGAIALRKLLDKPTSLFGTTLIGVNFFLQLGSECGRRVFLSFGLDPDLSYVPQIIIVMLFAELIPMLAARDHSEHLAMFTIKPIHLLSRLFFPLIWVIDGFSKGVIYFLKSPLKVNSSLSRDELKNLLVDSEVSDVENGTKDLEPLIENIFQLKTKTPRDMMIPIEEIACVSYEAFVGDVRDQLHLAKAKYIPLFQEKKGNIFGIVYSQDLLNVSDSEAIKTIARSPWFVVETNSIYQVINQFRKNNQKIAVVLDEQGSVIGVLSLAAIVNEIFSGILFNSSVLKEKSKVYIDKAFLAETPLSELVKRLKIKIPEVKNSTLEEYMAKKLGKTPKDGEMTHVGEYEFIFEGGGFGRDRKIRIRSRG